MQLDDNASTAARIGNQTGNGVSRNIKSDEVSQAKRGLTDTDQLGTTGVSEGKINQVDASMDKMREIISEMREYQGWGNFDINFDRDENTDSLVIKIIDRETGETLRQIPPDQVLKFKQHMQETLGLIFDNMA